MNERTTWVTESWEPREAEWNYDGTWLSESLARERAQWCADTARTQVRILVGGSLLVEIQPSNTETRLRFTDFLAKHVRKDDT